MRIVPTALPTLLATMLALAGCVTTPPSDPTAALQDPDVTRTVAENGDVIEQYRVNGRLKVVKVTPSRGPVYYLMDQDGDGKPDDEGPVSAVWWKLFEWN